MIRTTTGKHITADEAVTTKIEYANNTDKGKVMDVRNDIRVRLMIITKDKVAVQFNGPILKFSFENPANLEPIINLGPDPLQSDFDINGL
ncbi:MAG: hypothetical protein WA393_01840 [Nitrososphaeraceae archaeon]